MHNLSIWDLILTPLYLIILSYIARRRRDRKYPPGHILRAYYLPGLYVKFAGVIFIGLLYEFYYDGGDTFNFFYHAKVINSALSDSVETWFKLLLHASPNNDPRVYEYSSQMYWYNESSTYTVSVIAAIAGLLNGTTYIPIGLLFAFVAYSGVWSMLNLFVRIYPSLHKRLALAFLFIPSTIVWGSSLFKDTICICALGWLTFAVFRIFVDRDFSIKNLFLLSLSFYLLAIIKIYILLAFLPAIGLWILLTYTRKIRSAGIRWAFSMFSIAVIAGCFMFFYTRFTSQLNEYSIDNIAKKAQRTSSYIVQVSEQQEGSAYDLGKLDGTIGGMISKFPQAVVVTLYRPFLWEARKPIMILSALEGASFLYFTLLVFYRKGIFKSFKRITQDPNLLFFLVFTLIFAFAVGISTGNFGTLSRYKIPCMPFFAALLLIVYYQPEKINIIRKKKKSSRNEGKPFYRFA